MRCGFCGYDNLDGVKKCKHCKAKMALQQTYSRSSGSEFSGSVNQGSSGVTRSTTGANGTWQNSNRAGGARYGMGSTAGTRQDSQTAYRAVSTASNAVARSQKALTASAAKWIALAMILAPLLFTIIVLSMIQRVHKEWQQEAEVQQEGVADLQEELWEQYGLNKNGYYLEKNSDDDYTFGVNGFEYEMINCKTSANGTKDWRSDYFTGTFKRITQNRVRDVVVNSSFGESVSKIMYDVNGVFPLWLNYSEIDKVVNGEANRAKWTAAWSDNSSWTVLVLLMVNDDYPVTRECFDEIKDDLFFATKIEIQCNGTTYRYYPYEDRYEEE